MKEKELKNEDIQLLKTGMSDNVNLLNEDELGEIFAGYVSCSRDYFIGGIYCGCGYSKS